MSADDPIAAFRVEAGELLDQVEQGLLDLTHRLGDMDLVNAVFRGLHTLKGSGAMFGFDALAGFTHHCETAFDRVRKGQVPATPALVGVILSAQDHMRGLVEGNASESEGAAILASLQEAVDAASGGAAAPAKDAVPAAPASATIFTLSGLIPPSTSSSIGRLPMSAFTARILSVCDGMYACPPKPGFTDMTRIRSTSSIRMPDAGGRFCDAQALRSARDWRRCSSGSTYLARVGASGTPANSPSPASGGAAHAVAISLPKLRISSYSDALSRRTCFSSVRILVT